jgi:hypothetical protein
MGFSYEERVSPRGLPYIRLGIEAEIGVAEARDYVARFQPGGDYHGRPILAVVARGVSFDIAARKLLIESRATVPTSCVVTAPLARAAVNLMIRGAGLSSKARVFKTEPEALAWLEERGA